MPPIQLTIAFETPEQQARAEALSAKLQLPIDLQANNQLIVGVERLMLKVGNFSPLYADFSLKTWQKRRDAGKQQGLVRAVKPRVGMKIIDATAGLGRDAAILASFGAQVLLLERHPVLFVLLEDALARQDARSKEVLKLSLLEVDACHYLKNLSPVERPEVIYLDPMHPQRQKDALVKRPLQVLQQLIEPDQDVLDLLSCALLANSKVVVKWPQKKAPLKPAKHSISGKTVRFDIY